MTLKQDLLRVGYLPENLPPSFHTEEVANYFLKSPSTYLADTKLPTVRPAVYSSSKRGIARRTFSAIHPTTAHDLAEFLQARAPELDKRFEEDTASCSVPRHTPGGDRALEITSHNGLEMERLTRLAGYEFIAKTDISRFYHSIYTHSVPWAFHGKEAAKKIHKVDSEEIYFNRLDFTLRHGQYGQTIGIPVGPDASRYVAELICNAIDKRFVALYGSDVALIRHVDDVWIGTRSRAEAERALWSYRSCLREFELDVNESKTHIYSANFRFADSWPTDVAGRLELAIEAAENRRSERLRAALEFAFDLSVQGGDDGILKYAIRQLDRLTPQWDVWPILEPFLMRAAIHFGHTIDYVSRLLIWRKLTKDDLAQGRWADLIKTLLKNHGRLGNDHEVCWLLFAAKKLELTIPADISLTVVRNCGAMSIVAILDFVDGNDSHKDSFQVAFELVKGESANGPLWPVFLEWISSQWNNYEAVKALLDNELISSMCKGYVCLSDYGRPTKVFKDVAEEDYTKIPHAIETHVSSYDNEDEAAVQQV